MRTSSVVSVRPESDGSTDVNSSNVYKSSRSTANGTSPRPSAHTAAQLGDARHYLEARVTTGTYTIRCARLTRV